MKKVLGYSVIAFAVALAVVVGNRMSAEAMAVVIGVVCGVGASIPMSAIILAMSRRSRPQAEQEPGQRSGPPVVVVAPSPMAQPTAAWPAYPQSYPAPVAPAPREYRVIGEDQF